MGDEFSRVCVGMFAARASGFEAGLRPGVAVCLLMFEEVGNNGVAVLAVGGASIEEAQPGEVLNVNTYFAQCGSKYAVG